MHILQINTSDAGGGAERIAYALHCGYRERGHAAWLAVGAKRSQDPNVCLLPNDFYRSHWAHLWIRLEWRLSRSIRDRRIKEALRRGCAAVGQPDRWIARKRGYEEFNFPGSRHVHTLPPQLPEIIHGHNLHGQYFDLRALPELSRRFPVVLTLHDAWLLSGHCAHALNCQRWRTGCGNCPALTVYPALTRDATAHNWRKKQAIYAGSRLYLATPSAWLMQNVEQSMLAPAILEKKIIPHGIDLSVFQPFDKQRAREQLGLPQDVKIALFSAYRAFKHPFKDYPVLKHAVQDVVDKIGKARFLCLALGETEEPGADAPGAFRVIPYQPNPLMVAKWYQAADVYLHAAQADTFPNTVMEALACGTPVVATAVGGIPEQIEDGRTGLLAPAGDARSMAQAIFRALADEPLRRSMSRQAVQTARQRFDQQQMIDQYLTWYQAILRR